jgi:Fic-DOC domain mobile mystery protein B
MGLDSNTIPAQTPLDETEREGLKNTSVTTRWELDQLEQLNIEKALEWTIHSRFNVDQILTKEFIKKLHYRMMGNVWEWAGTFRRSNKNLGVDWTKIEIELRMLLDDTRYWIKNKTYGPDEICLRFKHRLVKIHCFPNGNGRHSRLIADLLIEKGLNKNVFTWNQSSSMDPVETRKEYIQAIKQADHGDLSPLIKFARS